MSKTNNETVIRLRNVKRIYKVGVEKIHALDGIDLDVFRNEYVAVRCTTSAAQIKGNSRRNNPRETDVPATLRVKITSYENSAALSSTVSLSANAGPAESVVNTFSSTPEILASALFRL